MLWPLLSSFVFVITSGAIIFRLQIKDKGLDPSLICYSNPLIHKGLWPLRGCLAFGFIFLFLVPAIGYFLLGLVIFAAVIQLIILFLFGRIPTQPALYYTSTAVSSLGLCLWRQPYIWGMVACIVFFQEIYLAYCWAKRQRAIYDSWVCRRTLKLSGRFHAILKSMPPKQQFAVLHIAITEDIARPAIVRLAERVYFRVKHPAIISSGIMQVTASSLLTDEESIRRGAQIIQESLDSMPEGAASVHEHLLWLSQTYNGSLGYQIYLKATYPGVFNAWSKINKN